VAHVAKRNGKYQAAYRGPDGRERTKTFDRKVDATAWLTSVEHSKLSGAYVDPSAGKVTFRDYAEQWRAVQIHRGSTATLVEQHLRLHIYPTLGGRPIAAVRPSEIQALVHGLGQRLSPSTVSVVYGRVAAVFGAAVRDRVVASSPCAGVKLPSAAASSQGIKLLTLDQVLAMADAVPDRYRALIIAGAGLGLRPAELFGLAADRVDFLRRTVRVDQQLVRKTGGVELGPLKTPASYRTVPLPAVVGDALARHMAMYPPHPESGLIFTSGTGGPVWHRSFADVWSNARQRAGVPGWATPHDWRHWYASALIQSGASVKTVQARLGHSSAVTTLNVYGHLWPDSDDATRAAIDEMLNPADKARTATPADNAV